MNRYRVDIIIYLVSALFLIGAVSVWWQGVWPSSTPIGLEPLVPDGQEGTGGGGGPAGQGGLGGQLGSGASGSGSGEGSEDPSSDDAKIVIHVAGAVLKPGVYELEEGQRVHDAVELAEAAEDADLDALNLAALLRDSDKVYVPRKGEGFPPGWTGGYAGVGSGQGSSGSSGGVGGGVRFPININTASPSELDALPGIGPSLANAIITYRNENGPFASPHDIVAVPGIGEKTYEKMADLIVTR